MAWQAFKQIEDVSDLADLDVIQDIEAPESETNAQVKAAVEGAKAIIASGELGSWENLHVHLSGHANRGHAPNGGQHDTVSVTVAVGKYED